MYTATNLSRGSEESVSSEAFLLCESMPCGERIPLVICSRKEWVPSVGVDAYWYYS